MCTKRVCTNFYKGPIVLLPELKISSNGKKLKNLQHHHTQVFPWLNICSNFVLVFVQPLPPQKSNCAPNFAKLVSCVILFARIVGDFCLNNVIFQSFKGGSCPPPPPARTPLSTCLLIHICSLALIKYNNDRHMPIIKPNFENAKTPALNDALFRCTPNTRYGLF